MSKLSKVSTCHYFENALSMGSCLWSSGVFNPLMNWKFFLESVISSGILNLKGFLYRSRSEKFFYCVKNVLFQQISNIRCENPSKLTRLFFIFPADMSSSERSMVPLLTAGKSLPCPPPMLFIFWNIVIRFWWSYLMYSIKTIYPQLLLKVPYFQSKISNINSFSIDCGIPPTDLALAGTRFGCNQKLFNTILATLVALHFTTVTE